MYGPCTKKNEISLWQVVLSVLAAMFGVQSNKTRERDFTHGNPIVFILVGLLLVACFIGTLVVVVKFALQFAQ
mgnify:CR=1 FL=1